MKCNSCFVPVPPTFTKALVGNECPACGKEIMGANLYQEFSKTKEMLADSDVDESTLVKVAALIAGKYELILKGAAGSGARRFAYTGVQRRDDVDEELEAKLAGLAPDEQVRERALHEAQRVKLSKEYGLDHGQLGVIGSDGDKARDPALDALVGELDPPNIQGLEDNPIVDPFEAERMAKLVSLRGNPDYQHHVNRATEYDG